MLHLSLMDSTGTKQLNFFWRFIIHYFRFHFTPEKGDSRNKPAKMAALSLHAWMVKHGIDNTVLVLGGDSTNENTGWQGKCFLLPFSYLIILRGHFVLAGEAFEQKSVLGGVPPMTCL